MRNRTPLIAAGLLLGVGLGGFVDGILLHQILQWHHMLTSAGYPATTVANLEVNTFWDGLFHAFTWLMTVAGLVLLWRVGGRRDVPWSTRTILGSVLAGWGLFNLVEGIIDHQILGIHHVRAGPNELAWDAGFLVFGTVLTLGGWMLVKAGRQDAVARAVPREEPSRRESDHAA